jgi:hypothetical protein
LIHLVAPLPSVSPNTTVTSTTQKCRLGSPTHAYFFGRRNFVMKLLLISDEHLLYNYLNRKQRLHVNSQQLEISTLIREKRIITHQCHYNFFRQKYPHRYFGNRYFISVSGIYLFRIGVQFSNTTETNVSNQDS